ncbi:MAG: hypothetical protein J5I90_12585 [Caldilineales bacterium]|nr:hypothetical protein [Caldilineales bacterium]
MTGHEFFDAVEQMEDFSFRQFNLFKVFFTDYAFNRQLNRQGQVWRQAQRQNSGRMILNRIIGFFIGVTQIIRLRLAHAPRTLSIFYGATGRITRIEDVTYDLYNARIVTESNRSQFVIVEDFDDGVPKTYSADLYISQFSLLIQAIRLLVRVFMSRGILERGERIAENNPALGYDHREAANIILTFYSNYLTLRIVLALLAPRRILMTCHYGRESFIAAAKSSGVPVIELMHGTVADNPFYIYPAGFSDLFPRALFPDRLAVYGAYWRNLVIEGNMFPPDSVFVGGYYLKTVAPQHKGNKDNRTTILITSQPTVQDEIADYVAYLKLKLDSSDWRIIIQPHPSENPDIFKGLLQSGFVEFGAKGTYELLADCDIHISVYSTVLFEALRYGVANYVLFVDSVRNRCEAIVSSGIARMLWPHEVPETHDIPTSPVALFFADYDSSTLFATDNA